MSAEWVVGALSGAIIDKKTGRSVAEPPEDVDPDSTEWRVTAAKMAAAPELLEALEKISRAGTLNDQDVIDTMRAAIAKARGR